MRGELAVADAELLEALGTPDIAVHTNRPEEEGRHAKRLRADFRVPGVEASEVQVGIAVEQLARLDRMRVVDEEQEHVAVARIERRRVLAYLDKGFVHHRRPVERARHFPARVADTVARDAHHGFDQFVIPDATVVGSGDRAQLDAAIVSLQRLDQLGAVRRQPVLEIDARQRCRKLTQVARRSADEPAELAEGPVRRHNRRSASGNCQREAADIVHPSVDPYRPGFDRAGGSARGPHAHCFLQCHQREIPFVVGPGEPFGRNPPDPLAAERVHLEAA